MKVFDYVNGVYLLSLFIHPPLFMVMSSLAGGTFTAGDFFLNLVNIGGMFLVGVLGLLFSLPAFALCVAGLHFIVHNVSNDKAKFALWLLLALLSILIGYFLIAGLFFGLEFFNNDIGFCLPGCLAAVLSIVLKRKKFYLLLQHLNRGENEYGR